MNRLSLTILATVAAFTMAASGDTSNFRPDTEALDPIDSRYFGVVSEVESGDRTILRVEGVITAPLPALSLNTLRPFLPGLL